MGSFKMEMMDPTALIPSFLPISSCNFSTSLLPNQSFKRIPKCQEKPLSASVDSISPGSTRQLLQIRSTKYLLRVSFHLILVSITKKHPDRPQLHSYLVESRPRGVCYRQWMKARRKSLLQTQRLPSRTSRCSETPDSSTCH